MKEVNTMINQFREFNPTVFFRASEILDNLQLFNAELDRECFDLLSALGYQSDIHGQITKNAPPEQLDDERKLLAVATKLERFFAVQPPQAPGLVFCAGELAAPDFGDRFNANGAISVGGIGVDFASAFRCCIGEAVEYLSQTEYPDQTVFEIRAVPSSKLLGLTHEDWFFNSINAHQEVIDCLQAKCLNNNSELFVPADFLVRRSPQKTQISLPYRLSSGCAAGRTFDDALCKAISEIIERDAVALWWYGGATPRRIVQSQLDEWGMIDLISYVRQDYADRETFFLDITSDTGVATVVAYSTDKDGGQFTCGTASHPDIREAMKSALFEMCQMELGLAFVYLKAEQEGDAALSDGDFAQLNQATRVKPDRCSAFFYDDSLSLLNGNNEKSDAKNSLANLTSALNETGFNAYYVDIYQPTLAVSAIKACIPSLQPGTTAVMTRRLQNIIKKSKGGWGIRNNIDLY